MISKEQERVLREEAKRTADKYIADPKRKAARTAAKAAMERAVKTLPPLPQYEDGAVRFGAAGRRFKILPYKEDDEVPF